MMDITDQVHIANQEQQLYGLIQRQVYVCPERLHAEARSQGKSL